MKYIKIVRKKKIRQVQNKQTTNMSEAIGSKGEWKLERRTTAVQSKDRWKSREKEKKNNKRERVEIVFFPLQVTSNSLVYLSYNGKKYLNDFF